MFRLILRLTLLPLFFLSAMLFMIRAQPFDGQEIRSFLQPGDCSKLCFMGIQPGITKPQDAISLLRSNAWISRVGVSELLQTVTWYWNDTLSSFLNENEIPALFYNNDAVSTIQLYTNIRLGDLLLEFGQMPGGKQRVAIRRNTSLPKFNVDLYYLGNGYVLHSVVNCRNFWTQPTRLILGARPQFIEAQGFLTTSLNKAKHAIASLCRREKQL